jgi:hypothetical protein
MSAREDILHGLRQLDESQPGDLTPEQLLDAYRTEVLHEAAAALEADMERFFSVFPDEPRNSPYALGHKDASDEVRRMVKVPRAAESEATS